MFIRAGYDLHVIAPQPVPMLAMLSIHPSRHKDLISLHRIVAVPDIPFMIMSMGSAISAPGSLCRWRG
jgi:hypothetical protein